MRETGWGCLHIVGFIGWLAIIFLSSEKCFAGVTSVGKIYPGYQGSQMNWIDKQGFFLESNRSEFAFGFTTANNVTSFLLAILHVDSSTVIWSANRGSPVSNSDNFEFDVKGNAFLKRGQSVVWSTETRGKGVSVMELRDDGNLVLLGTDSKIKWQSFDHPTDTLLPNQSLVKGMKLISAVDNNNLTYILEISSGDMVLSAGSQIPQPYWSIQKDNRRTINKHGGTVASASIAANSWRFYDQSNSLLWQFIFADGNDTNATWIAVLGREGFISFFNLKSGKSSPPSSTKIPDDACSTPEPCGAYYICSSGRRCQCPSVLNSQNCNPGLVSPCGQSKDSTELVSVGDGIGYFALGFLPPSSRTNLNDCKASCLGNCSCLAMFFNNSTGNCFLLDSVGSFTSSGRSSSDALSSYIKVLSGGGGGTVTGEIGSSNKHFQVVIIIIVPTALVICCLLYGGYHYYKKKKRLQGSPRESSEEDNFLENLSGMPVRFSYKDLQNATNNFSVKLGQGGFGSVYQGALPDGSRIAVKKLEGIGQGKKEFRAEVSIIGSIHHVHLVRLKGFCAEGSHRLLAYEYMKNGSLDKWIFRKSKDEVLLDWDTRFNIAWETAKGLAYLHEDCDAKIIHCDIKPENVLLDDKFVAKVSDFGLAKLMNREQSHVFTTLRGTRGYLAPEWITNYAISEKSDVYSYGMVLLEIIGGRKNFDPRVTSEKSHFPSYAFRMMEEGKVEDILDSKLEIDDDDPRVHLAVRVALWCIQEDMSLRPSMSRVVQMLEGLCHVPPPPTSSVLGNRLYSGLFKSISEEGTSSGPSDCNSDTYLSAVRLSGPR